MVSKVSKKTWSIGGGKGGIGKSVFTLALGITLARLGQKVVLLDLDLGGANLHTMMGLRYPPYTLEDFFLKRVPRLGGAITPTPIEGLGIICGVDDFLGMANFDPAQKLELLREIEALPADLVLLDLGAGIDGDLLDLFNFSAGRIALLTSQSTSLQRVHAFLKSAFYRYMFREFAGDEQLLWLLQQAGSRYSEVRLNSIHGLINHLKKRDEARHHSFLRAVSNFQVCLVVNMVRQDQETEAAKIIQSVCADYLSIHLPFLGEIPFDPEVEKAVDRMIPFPPLQAKSPAVLALRGIARNFLMECGFSLSTKPSPASSEKARDSDGLNRFWGQAPA